MANGGGRRGGAGHAANAGMKTCGADGLYRSEARGRSVVASPAFEDDLSFAQCVENWSPARRP